MCSLVAAPAAALCCFGGLGWGGEREGTVGLLKVGSQGILCSFVWGLTGGLILSDRSNVKFLLSSTSVWELCREALSQAIGSLEHS